MAQRFLNNCHGVLATAIVATDTAMTVKDMQGLPASLAADEFFLLTLYANVSLYGNNLEVVKVTALVDNADGTHTLTIVRGVEGSALDHAAGEFVEGRLTAQSLHDLLNNAQTYADAQIAALIDASPTALDTLNELAAALGDDPNFATTMTNALADKLDKTSYTAADVLAKLLTVDGAGSGLDADTLDGEQLSTIEARLKRYAEDQAFINSLIYG